MSTAVSMEPLGSTQQLRWVAKELAVLALWFGLAVIRHDNVCFVWFHAYVNTWFPNNRNGGWGVGREWPSSEENCHEYSGLWVSFKWYFIHTKREKSAHSCLRCLVSKERIFIYLFLLGPFSEAPDLKQEERLQELESCSGVGSTSDDTEVREVSSRPSTPGLSVVSGINLSSSLSLSSSP